MDGAAARLADALRDAIADQRVLEAIALVPRERFVPAHLRDRAYEDVALPIGSGQTISQPVVVARMLELLALRGDERVLDVGTGSGYHAALLAALAAEVFSIERHPELSASAERALASLGIGNVTLFIGDGSDGLPEQAPFDAINVAAATGEDVPAASAPAARRGWTPGCARSASGDQRLLLMRRRGDELVVERHEPVRFVPLVREGSSPTRLAPDRDRRGDADDLDRHRAVVDQHIAPAELAATAPSVPSRRTGQGTSRQTVRTPPRSGAARPRASASGSRSSRPVGRHDRVEPDVGRALAAGGLLRPHQPGAMYGSRSTASASKWCAPGVRTYDEDRVVLGGPAAARLGAVVVGPDKLVEERLAPEDLVKQQLAVVRLAVVDVK